MFFRVFKLNIVILVILFAIFSLFTSITIKHLNTSVATSQRRLPIYSVETDKKQIAITFDAAWSADDTDELLKILEKHKAKITVFAVGEWVERNPKAVKKFHNSGHEIGNHSSTHAAFSQITQAEIRKEITDCSNAIKTITGVTPKTVRAPSGDYDNKSIEIAETLGMKMIQWDVDSLDYRGLSVDEIYSRITTKVQNGSIVLFHNGVENTPEALDKILIKLEKDGYEFVTVSELIYWDNYTIDHTGRQAKL